MFAFGSIVLTRFPFTDLSGDKRRPALVVSRDNDRRSDLVVCFITSIPRTGPDIAPLAATTGTGLKVPSAKQTGARVRRCTSIARPMIRSVKAPVRSMRHPSVIPVVLRASSVRIKNKSLSVRPGTTESIEAACPSPRLMAWMLTMSGYFRTATNARTAWGGAHGGWPRPPSLSTMRSCVPLRF